MKILDITNINSTKNAAAVLKSGGVLVMPTDTVYGVGCILESSAINKLYKVKDRSESQPTAILMNEDVFERTSIFDGQLPVEFWSGKMTIVFKVKEFNISFPEMITQNGTIGVRLPNHSWLSNLINEVGPIVAASANKRGQETPTSFSQISPEIIEEADLTIKTDEKMAQKASTIFDLAKNQVLRS